MEKPIEYPTVHHATPAQWGRSVFFVFLPVFACFLGGGTAKWAEGMVVAVLGAFLIIQPPRRSLGWGINAVFVAFSLCALLSFLPHHWFFIPQWRTALTNDFGIELPDSVTPQPWLTAGCFVSLMAGVCWLYRVSAQQLELRVARFQLRLFAFGVVVIAGLSILFYLTHNPPLWWQNDRGFGPFPNRNQTADLFGITSVLILACGQDDIRHRRKRWILWALALALVIAAIILNFSRAGVVILVVASALWIGIVSMRVGSVARLWLGIAFLLLILSALLIAGGRTLERLHLQQFAGSDFSVDFSQLTFCDTWNLIRSSPWCGIGLGNFDSVFAIFRGVSPGNTRALHPQSDWLWVWAEMGFLALPLILIGTVLLTRQVWPLQIGTNQRFRLAALIGALMFALHGLIDVSAHQVGTGYSAMFLLGLSLHRPTQLRTSQTTPWVFRALGIGLLVAGASWTIAWRTMALTPGPVGVRNAKLLATAASRGRNFTEAIDLATRALSWAPLDWELYYLRATAEVSQGLSPQIALDDFRRARVLEPTSYSLPLEEGFVWLRAGHSSLASAAWAEAVRRAGADRRNVFRTIILTASMRDATARGILQKLAFAQPTLALDYLAQAPATEFGDALTMFLQLDPDLKGLTIDEKRELFRLWRERGGLSSLVTAVERHPEWLPLAWRAMASARAAAGDFQVACALMQKFGSETTLPALETGQTLEQLRARAYQGSNDFAAGYSLYREQMNRGQTDEALATARHFVDQPTAPAYFHLLEAQAWAAKEDWRRSWNCWIAFERAKAAKR
jgi:O-antigen ligase/tetratricopeptide (TPR) repeat protein